MIPINVFLVFIAICYPAVESSPFTIDILENRDIIFPRRSYLNKRTANNDVSELNQQKVSLASFIENIETGILQTAFSVDSLASDSHAEVQNTSTPHPVERRSTKEEISGSVESSTPLVLVQTSENVPAVDSVPSHVVIDRVSVFKTPDVGSGLFPTFLVQDTNGSSDATEVSSRTDDDEEGSTPASNSELSQSEESIESVESSESSEEKSTKAKGSSTTEKKSSSVESSESSEEKSTKAKGSSTTEKESSSTVSPASSSSSTTPLTVEEKKSVENKLKEKIGEVEAEPVIFTARV